MSSQNNPSTMESSVELAGGQQNNNGQQKADAPSIIPPPAIQPTDHKQEDQRPMSPANDSASAVNPSREDPAVALRKLLKGKEHEWSAAISRKQGKLTLLELPLDILRMVVSEVRLGSTLLQRGEDPHANARLDHTHQRPLSSRPDELDTIQPCCAAHILSFRHCVARRHPVDAV